MPSSASWRDHLRREFDDARSLYEATKRRLDGPARNPDHDNLQPLVADRLFAEATMTGSHWWSASDGVEAAAKAATTDPASAADPLVRLRLLLSRCVFGYETARFEVCRQSGLEVLPHIARGGFRHAEVFVNLHLGMAAMAQGRAEEAASRYADARRITKAFFASDAALAAVTDALVIELDIERDREKAIEQRTVSGLTELRGVWIDAHEAAVGVAAELTFTRHGAEPGLQYVADEIARLRPWTSVPILRYASALRSLYLMEAGYPDRAERVWQQERLPTDATGLLDLDSQSWREMEALSCARIRLLTELGRRDAARDLANRLRRIASERGLVRTLMRALALSMTIDAHTDRASEPLVEFLQLTRSTDYLRPLARRRDVSRDLLTRLLDSNPNPDVREAARSVLSHLDGPPRPEVPVFSPREQAVLAELGNGLRNREIADRLGMTEDGVRQHLKNIYRKTGTSDRDDAVRRAASMGVQF